MSGVVFARSRWSQRLDNREIAVGITVTVLSPEFAMARSGVPLLLKCAGRDKRRTGAGRLHVCAPKGNSPAALLGFASGQSGLVAGVNSFPC